MLRSLSFFLLLIAFFGAAPAFSADKKKAKLPVPPPQPVAQEVTVKRGEAIEIRLSIYGRKYENLTYLIRTAPEKGKLTEPKAVTQEASVVTYQSPANLAVKHDHFSYAVQNGAGVSAAVEIGITIVDEAEQLITPDLLEFPPLLAGGAGLKEIEISNIGGSVCAGEVKATAPWRIEGPASYKLAAGARQKFLVFFEPKEAGDLRGELRYTSQPTRVTSLRGVCASAFGASPQELRLVPAAGSTVRAGRLEVTNNTPDEQKFTLTGSPRIDTPATVTVPAGGKAPVLVSIKDSDPSAFDDALTIEGAGLQVRVAVRAPAIGPVLKIDQAVLHFPPVRQGQPSHLGLKIENAGGTAGMWKAQTLPPFVVDGDANIHLDPREQKEIRISVSPDEVGSYRGSVRFEGEQQTAETQLEADVVLTSFAGAPVAPGAPAKTRPPDTASEEEKARFAKENDARISALVYLRDHVKVRNVGSDSAIVEWPTSLTNAHSCRVELRSMRMDDTGHLQADWPPAPVALIKQSGDQFVAELHGLRPGSVNTIRVVPVPEAGESTTPLFIAQIETLAPKAAPFRINAFNIAVFLLVVIAGGTFAWKRVHRVEEE